VICERLCGFAGELLEYCGTVHLELPSLRHSSRHWPGGEPFRWAEIQDIIDKCVYTHIVRIYYAAFIVMQLSSL
jgi:hypothetical protein